MAAADYCLCDVCSSKTFYDTDVNYDRAGDMRCICVECAKTHAVRIVVAAPMPTPAAADDARDAARWRWLMASEWEMFKDSWLNEIGIYGDGPEEFGQAVDALCAPAAKPADPAEEQGS